MQSLLVELRRAVAAVWARVLALLQSLFGVASGGGGGGAGTSGGASWTTGVLGLAALLVAVHHLRGSSSGSGGSSGGRGDPRRQQQQQAGAGPSAAAGAARGKPGTGTSGGGASTPNQPLSSPLAPAVRARLPGVRRVCISVPGVLLVERSAARVSRTGAARARPGAAALVRALSAVAREGVFLVAHVADDVGQAVVSGALEAAGVVGRSRNGSGVGGSKEKGVAGGAAGSGGPGAPPPPVPLHRLLFVSTLDGKASVVRQLEPCVHVDAHPATIEALQRFMPRLVLVDGAEEDGGIADPGAADDAPVVAAARAYASAGAPPPNVTVAPSLAGYLGLSEEVVAEAAKAGMA
jgi:hypothetical protein